MRELDYSINQLTSLPPLNEKLEELDCFHNQLTSLPPLNEKLEELDCFHNQLTSLPPLNEKLEALNCSFNKLTSFPHLNESLKRLVWDNNPIYCLILFDLNVENSLKELNKKLNIINKFRHLYYSLKFNKHFIKWLWKSREKQIIEKYHPKYLLENLEENTDLDEFLENW